MPHAQTYRNHRRWDPLYHFVLMPVLLTNLVLTAVWRSKHLDGIHRPLGIWLVLMSGMLVLMAALIRHYALKNQNRVIRLEERLRLAALLPSHEVGLASKLTSRQLIALRFASDMELPMLARRSIAEDLSPRQIKESIEVWRPDLNRI